MNTSYTIMQLNQYNYEASLWSEENKNPVVGGFDDHNAFAGYDNLFTRFTNPETMVGLDFACGPGRNIVKYKDKFKRLDGVDISPINIKNAEEYTKRNGIVHTNLYVSNGTDISVVPSNAYDFVMSTIALQHICVHSIRYSILSDIHRVLKSDGIFTAQMGYGPETASKQSVGYYENFYEAWGTNGKCDTRVESPLELESDLTQIGFKEFQYTIGETGPGDGHPNWIYFSVKK